MIRSGPKRATRFQTASAVAVCLLCAARAEEAATASDAAYRRSRIALAAMAPTRAGAPSFMKRPTQPRRDPSQSRGLASFHKESNLRRKGIAAIEAPA